MFTLSLSESSLTRLRMVPFVARMLRHGPRARHTVADMIEERAADAPERCFVRFEGRTTTYREYNGLANRVAHWALSRGVGRGDAVALLMQNRPEFLAIWAGIAKTGATTALINTNLSGRALTHVLAASRARHMIVGAECLESLLEVDPVVLDDLAVHVTAEKAGNEPHRWRSDLHDLDAELERCPEENPPRSVRRELRAGDDLFYIYTSGTTGLPKAARFSHSRFFGACIHSYLKGFAAADTMYCPLPLYHTVGGVMAVSAVLTAGGTLALARRFRASRFWDDVTGVGASAFVYIGELCRYLLLQPTHPRERSHGLRFVVGNGLRPDIWEAFRDRFAIPHIVEFYGATEANVAMINFDDRVGSVGKLPFGIRGAARLIRYDVEREEHVRENGACAVCGPGEVGELIGRIGKGKSARGRFEGYTSREATEQKILHDVFTPGDTWFRSGDLLRFDEEGYFYFVDRIGDTFRWKGENVSTQEVAEAISAFPGVRFCTVYGVEVPGADGRAGMAAINLSGPFDGTGLYRHIARTLPPYAAPAFVRLREELDVTGTFKLRKVDLQREGFDTAAVSDPIYVRDDACGAFVPLTESYRARIAAGSLRL